MPKKLYATALLVAAITAVAIFSTHASPTTAARSSAQSELAALPSSDIVAYVDAQKIFSDVLPNFFAGQTAQLSKINARLDELKTETGVDMRSFDSFAVGVSFVRSQDSARPKHDDLRFVALSRGHFNADSVIANGLAKAKARCSITPREEQIAGRTVYVFKPVGRGANCPASGTVNNSDELAVAALDSNTIVSGDLVGVRAALDSNAPRVSSEIVELATRTPNAVLSWGGVLPAGAGPRAEESSDPLSRKISTIRQFYGSVTVAGTEAETFIGLRTETAEQAQDLGRGLNSLKMVSKLGMTNGAGRNQAERASISKLLDNLSVSTEDNEVQIKLNVAQADLAPFMRF